MRRILSLSRNEALLLLLIGLIAGSVCLFYWAAGRVPVSIDDAVEVRATYSGHEFTGRRGSVSEIRLYFDDHDGLVICGSNVDGMVDYMLNVPEGMAFDMLVHPERGHVLSLEAGGNVIMPFDGEYIGSSAAGNLFLACGCYLMALCGLVRLIYGFRRKSE